MATGDDPLFSVAIDFRSYELKISVTTVTEDQLNARLKAADDLRPPPTPFCLVYQAVHSVTILASRYLRINNILVPCRFFNPTPILSCLCYCTIFTFR